LPQPEATAASLAQASPASEWAGKQTGRMVSVKFTYSVYKKSVSRAL
jgi:hypothetical protein